MGNGNPFDFSGGPPGPQTPGGGRSRPGRSVPKGGRRPGRAAPGPVDQRGPFDLSGGPGAPPPRAVPVARPPRRRWPWLVAAGVVLAGVVGVGLWFAVGPTTATAPRPQAGGPPAAAPGPGSGPVVYAVTGQAGATVTYAAGGSLGSVSAPVRLPWRVTVPTGGPGSVYTVAVTGGGGTCSITREGRELDRQAAAPGRPLVCSAAG